ncbi:Uncharacterised protein [Actinobacillus seminis]|uniref:Lytic protein Rz1, bacteriophage protein n=2 Tax=Actinobacillus seminis TaxID=722 RepID=A0A380VDP9_9PAST|nr:hypothetical protein [Actinobacillus seminis]SUU36718.1 Uncharacterised protein [Actinobacillus seminis]
MMLLSGCNSQTKSVYWFPPQAYTVPCDQSSFTGKTYGEAVVFLRQVMSERDVCAGRIKGIIEWREGIER